MRSMVWTGASWVRNPPGVTSSDYWDQAAAEAYDEDTAQLSTPEALAPVLDALQRLAAGGRALELAIGTGRVAVPLAARGVPVAGIELSEPMVAQLRRKVDAHRVPVVVGDMATTTAEGTFSLVYLVFNTISNLRTQAEQVACFRNAARHLEPGGCFVVELWVPPLRRLPPGQLAAPFDVSETHVGMDTYDLVTQQGTSHHYTRSAGGGLRYGATNFRYAWPAECDLMAELAGMHLESRGANWTGAPFTSDSESHVSIWRKP